MPVDLKIQIPMLKTLVAALNVAGVDGQLQLKAALYGEAELIMAESKQRVPVDKGILRASGHVESPKEQGGMITVDLVYGGAAAPYAIHVHENLAAHHNVGEAKYLERPALEAADRIPDRLAEALDRALRKVVNVA